MKKGKVKQILLITDGCSNVGGDPVAVASMAKEYGITVNVIGIVDDQALGDKGKQEVQDIATAGNGIHQLVYSEHLPKTVQMVTRKAMNQTIQQVVNQELRQLLAEDTPLEQLAPAKRGKIVEVVEELGETVALDVLLLIDTSASMKSKLPALQQALRDLTLSMQSRMGENQFALWTFPGLRAPADKLADWTKKFSSLESLFSAITPQGTTPTGPALEQALCYFTGEQLRVADEEEGLLRDYVL